MNQKKQNFFTLLFSPLLAVPLAAQSDLPASMQTVMEQAIALFTGDWVKLILVLAFTITAIVFGVNKDNENMKKNCIAIGIAIVLIGAASTIVGTFWDVSIN